MLRIIPAHAGKRGSSVGAAGAHGDHPRSCGEKPELMSVEDKRLGSSPLMRGKVPGCCCRCRRSGIIPAHAGKSPCCCTRSPPPGDHPRSCGEKDRNLAAVRLLKGSSPLMRGKVSAAAVGLAPSRIIPAHAGKRQTARQEPKQKGDHPRSCGEKQPRSRQHYFHAGSSPLMRGKAVDTEGVKVPDRIIPAHAGKSYRQQPRSRQH